MTNEFESLIPKAEVIRDAVYEGENSAERVGGLFVELVTAAAEAIYGPGGTATLLQKISRNGLLAPGDALAVEHKGKSATITFPTVSPDGTPGTASAVIGAVGNKAGLMLPSHAESIEANTAAVSSLRGWVQALPVLDFAGTVAGVASAPGLGRIQTLTAHAQGLTEVVFDTLAQKFLLRVTSGETAGYYETWTSAGSGETALRASLEYAPGALFSNGGVLYSWDGPGSDLCGVGTLASLAPRVGHIESRLERHEERLGDLVYKTDYKLRPEVDKLTTAANELAARVAALEEGTGGSGGEAGECGCGAIASESIEALFAEEPEPEGPADGEPVTTAQLDDLIDDGVAQTPVEAPPGEYRLDEDDINALIEGIFN